MRTIRFCCILYSLLKKIKINFTFEIPKSLQPNVVYPEYLSIILDKYKYREIINFSLRQKNVEKLLNLYSRNL